MQCAFLSCENTLWRSTCDAQRTPTAVAADGVKIGNLEHVDSVYIYIAKLIFDSAYLFVPYVYIYIYTTWQFVSAVGKSLRWCKCLDDGFPSPKKSSLRQSRFSLGKKCFKPQFGMFFLGSKSLDLWRLWVPVRTGEHKLGSFHFYALTSWLVKGHNCGYTRRDKLKNVSFRCSYDLPTWGLSLNVSTVWIPNSQRFIMAFSL